MIRSVLLVLAVCSSAFAQQPRWRTLPATPSPVAGMQKHYTVVNGIRLFYEILPAADGSHKTPVILLHGGLANSDYFGNQVRALHPHHSVMLVDSRGHGRSSRNAQPFGYDLMADDVVALMDTLHLPQADIVGWSDGAILGIDLALRHPTRVRRIFAFAANVTTDGVIADNDKNPVFAAYIQRAGEEYRRLSPTPTEYSAFTEQIAHMWLSQPEWTAAQLATIHTPVLVADGDHDEAIVRGHSEKIAAMIPGATLLILPATSHFAFLQAPGLFNTTMMDFLDR